MKATNKSIKTVDEYIARCDPATQKILKKIRVTIKKAAPVADEVISYQMPAYKQNRALVYFAAYARHIGFYPTASGISAFKKDLSAFKHAKGSVQFPLDKPIPYNLITKIVAFRVRK